MMVTMLPKHSTPAVCLVQAPIAVAFVGPQGAGKSLLLWLGGCCAPYRRCWSPEPSCSVSLSWLLATAKTSRTVLTFSSFQTLSTSSLSSLPSYTGNEHASAFASQTLNVGHTYWYYVSRALSGWGSYLVGYIWGMTIPSYHGAARDVVGCLPGHSQSHTGGRGCCGMFT